MLGLRRQVRVREKSEHPKPVVDRHNHRSLERKNLAIVGVGWSPSLL